ncbi:hypothetical protein RhiLY_00326 [Ceratobasidium sp. AG-Ba]|nr:hypothetical protein RhiLY_00326 [Ceratobasidium sp. AG-Ba]
MCFVCTEDGVIQVVLYQSGVGVPDNFEGDNSHRRAKALGAAVASKIRDTYNFIVQNYSPGDQIYLFGFSRGAYTVRKVAGLLDGLGILSKPEMSFFFRHWLSLYKGDGSEIGSVRNGPSINDIVDILGFQDTSLPNCVKQARHAISYHEERNEMRCTPFKPEDTEKRLVQVWFPGVHRDVGGGYPEHQIADLSLLWMAGELEELGVKIDKEYLNTRLSSGAETLEVHHEQSLDPRNGDRGAILKTTLQYPSTYYHRSMWGKLRHVNAARQSHLEEMTSRLQLSSSSHRMKPLNPLEHEYWASRWNYYISNPTQPQSRGSGARHEQVSPPYVEHEAPLEEESPYVLFERT